MSSPLIMVGAGHAHLIALRGWIEQGYQVPPGSTLISPEPHAWYSGMMPGMLAGRWQPEQCRIALAPLCDATGLTLHIGRLAHLDADNRLLELDSGEQLRSTVLSINSGAMNPAPPDNDQSLAVIGAKPFADLFRYWQTWQAGDSPEKLVILGGGAAAVELALALQKALPRSQLTLLCASRLLAGHPAGAARTTRSLFAQRGITLHENTAVTAIERGTLRSADAPPVAADAVILATGTAPAAWQPQSGLATDKAGFISIDATLQSTSHPQIFASGDCAALAGCPHSGVYAVRQGPILGANLRAQLQGSPPQLRFEPQPRALALLATADRQALACYGPLALRSRAALWLKNRLDTDFMRSLQLDCPPG